MSKKKYTKEEMRQDKFLILVGKLLHFYTHNKKKIMIFAIIFGCLLIIILAPFMYLNMRKNTINAMYTRVSNVNDLKTIIEKYPRATESAQAYFLLADRFFSEAKYEEALYYYSNFVQQYPQHFLTPYVFIDMGYCFENLGKLNEAKDSYKKVADLFPTSSASFQGLLNAARCYLDENNSEQAQALYQKVIEKDPFGLWSREARRMLKYLEMTE